MMNGFGLFGTNMGITIFSFGMMALIVWSFIWKGLALWHSAKRKEPWWFIAILLVNTAGILEIIYLFAVAKMKRDELFK
ncbi:MAG: DUF5652 family protein [Patescibacteria group bacterium]